MIEKDTVVVVTGASSGIGRALALECARRGARVALLARRMELLQQVAHDADEAGGKGLAIQCDVSSRSHVIAAIKQTRNQFGEIDVLINNAGRGNYARTHDTSDEQLQSIFGVNVFSMFHTIGEVLPTMLERRNGTIVNIASLAGKIGYPSNAAYVAAKHAVVGLTRALRSELYGTGVRAVVAIPAGTKTDWVNVTEGGTLAELFAYEQRRGKEIAIEMGSDAPPEIQPLDPEVVALNIINALQENVAEIYTHDNSRELVVQYEQHQSEVEQMLAPYWLANREGYQG